MLAAENGVLSAARVLPEYPEDCAVRLQNGVKNSEPLDVALLRLNNRLDQSNARMDRCEQWYLDLRAGFEGGAQ